MSPTSRSGTGQRVLSKDALPALSHPTLSSSHQSPPSMVSSIWEDSCLVGCIPRVPEEVPGPSLRDHWLRQHLRVSPYSAHPWTFTQH